jgi:hypothetical protein
MKKTLDTPYVYLELDNDVLIGVYKKGVKITLEVAKEIVEARLKFAGYKPVLALAYNAGVVSMNKEARDYLASTEGIEGVIAGAIVVGSPLGSFIANFYLSVSKPRIPTKAFTKKEAALKWLQQFREITLRNE